MPPAALPQGGLRHLGFQVASDHLSGIPKVWRRAVDAPRNFPGALNPKPSSGRRLLAAYLQLSAELYDGGAPYPVIWATLAALGVVGWRFTDGTKQVAPPSYPSPVLPDWHSFSQCELAGAIHQQTQDVRYAPTDDAAHYISIARISGYWLTQLTLVD